MRIETELGSHVAFGASAARPIDTLAGGFLAIAGAVTCYALGQKLFPGLHEQGLFNLNQTGEVPRLQQPLGYWNALALFLAMAVPIALGFSADPSRSARLRAVMSDIAEINISFVPALTFLV